MLCEVTQCATNCSYTVLYFMYLTCHTVYQFLVKKVTGCINVDICLFQMQSESAETLACLWCLSLIVTSKWIVNIMLCPGSKEPAKEAYQRMRHFSSSCSVLMPRHSRRIQSRSGIALLRRSDTDISTLKKQKMNTISMIVCFCIFSSMLIHVSYFLILL